MKINYKTVIITGAISAVIGYLINNALEKKEDSQGGLI